MAISSVHLLLPPSRFSLGVSFFPTPTLFFAPTMVHINEINNQYCRVELQLLKIGLFRSEDELWAPDFCYL